MIHVDRPKSQDYPNFCHAVHHFYSKDAAKQSVEALTHDSVSFTQALRMILILSHSFSFNIIAQLHDEWSVSLNNYLLMDN